MPTAVSGLTTVAEIRTGGWFSCARLIDGTLRCWGSNANGELGNGTSTSSTTPTPVLL